MRSEQLKQSGAVRQRGVAIITAMLVIALGTITMVSITSSQQLALQREINEGLIQQARALGISGERFATAVLFRDHQDALREGTDSPEDDWAQTLPPVPIDNSSIEGCMVDMQGKFNLNNLVDDAGNVVAVQETVFRQLLTVLSLPSELADAVLDWVDSDFNARPQGGAEDDYYTGLEVGYKAANRPFTSISELHLVKGLSSAVEEELEIYNELLPHIAVIPKPRVAAGSTATAPSATEINVNTATHEVLASIGSVIDLGVADQISSMEPDTYEDYPKCEELFDLADEAASTDTLPRVSHYETLEEFEQAVRAAAPPATNSTTEGGGSNAPPPVSDVPISLKSSYFQLRIDVVAEDITLTQYSLLHRDDSGRSRVLYRSRDTL